MNITLQAAPPHARAGLITWKQPAMALLVVLLFGPIFAAPLAALVWAVGGLMGVSLLTLEIAEVAALAVAAAPTAWLARRGWRAEGRMAQGLDV